VFPTTIEHPNAELPPEWLLYQDRYHTPVLRTDPDSGPRSRNLFVGIAVSGGGSRAANFGAAVLEELDKRGLLQHAYMISSVSGGSLPVAYYGLFRNSADWRWGTLRSLLLTDFLSAFIRNMGSAGSITSFLAGHINKADVLAKTFDQILFRNKTFSDLGSVGPHITINATNLEKASRFTFTEPAFRDIDSRLDSFPVSYAVAASGAYPGVFDNVSLRDYKRRRAFHDEDFVSPKKLVDKILNGSDPLSTYLRHRFSSLSEIELLSKRRSIISSDISADSTYLDRLKRHLDSPLLPEVLRQGLNWIISSEDDDLEHEEIPSAYLIYTKDRFEGVTLSEETIRLLRVASNGKPETKELFEHLNRLLLEDAYSEELKVVRKRYIHLYDGGPTDNLGLDSVIQEASLGASKDSCLLISIDAHAEGSTSSFNQELDTRRWYDWFINSNAIAAMDALFERRRIEYLTALSPALVSRYRRPVTSIFLPDFEPDRNGKQRKECFLWHVRLMRLLQLSDHDFLTSSKRYEGLRGYLRALYRNVSTIETNYKLKGACRPEQLQELLYEAARILVGSDMNLLRPLQSSDIKSTKNFLDWLKDRGVNFRHEGLKVGTAPVSCDIMSP
jgi:hypothetical protein